MMEKAIKAVNLTKSYGKLLAVDHINFEVKKGEIFGFLGPNGAGKTTTTRMLTGISKPTEGTAEIMGYDIQRQSVEAKELMGIVPDISNVYTDLSAWGNLTFTGRLYDVPKVDREKRAKELLQLFGLFDRRKESVQGFSRGMKRRLCIAMALMNKSSILFLDEPTSGLDVQSVLTIRNLVRKLNEDGLTIFLTTHNMEEANQMCDRVAIINRGKIAAIDTPEMLKKTIKKLQFIEASFVGATKNLNSDLEKLQGVAEVAKHGDKYRINTENPPKVLSAIWEYASANELEIHTVNTLGPSLEDVFVKLTGITPEMKRERSEVGIRAGS
jgi:ABC-2 type transport system ATP-binding protein